MTQLRFCSPSPSRRRTQSGMNTAEYAVGTVAACGFAGLLFKLLTSPWAEGMLQDLLAHVTDQLPF